MDYIKKLMQEKMEARGIIKKFDDFRQGDSVNVHVVVKEGEKERTQIFSGVVLKVQGTGLGKSFTVRKVSSGIGVERTFPFASSKLEKVEVVSRGKTRRSRIFFLRDRKGRAARLNSELVTPMSKKEDKAAKAKASADTAAE